MFLFSCFTGLRASDVTGLRWENIVKDEDGGINKHVTFHVARHTFATLILTQGADINTVCKLLGHSDVSVTQIYAKVIDKKKKEATHLLDNVL